MVMVVVVLRNFDSRMYMSRFITNACYHRFLKKSGSSRARSSGRENIGGSSSETDAGGEGYKPHISGEFISEPGKESVREIESIESEKGEICIVDISADCS